MYRALRNYNEMMENLYSTLRNGAEQRIQSISKRLRVNGDVESSEAIDKIEEKLRSQLMPKYQEGFFPHYIKDLSAPFMDGLMPHLDNLQTAVNPYIKNKPKTIADHHAKVNFPPWKHLVWNPNKNRYKEVARSHWKGTISTGKFCVDHGYMTDELANMCMKLTERYATRSNWRGYTYVDEMRSQALLQLSQISLQFDESKSQNPFAYYTAAITNSFTRVLNVEKRSQNIRDDLLEKAGHSPSYTRQMAHHLAIAEKTEAERRTRDGDHETERIEQQIERKERLELGEETRTDRREAKLQEKKRIERVEREVKRRELVEHNAS